MEFVFATEADIPQICALYKERLNYDMTPTLYRHFYQTRLPDGPAGFSGIIARDGGQVVGHNALIINLYRYREQPFTLGLSSGGMVKPEHSGIFFPLLKKCFKMIPCDGVIAFPNQQSQGFFTRIFDFQTIQQNYFTLSRERFSPEKALFATRHWQRTAEHIAWRLQDDPRYDYQMITCGAADVWFKTFRGQQLDLVYVSEFTPAVLQQIGEWLKSWEQINFVHWDEDFCRSIGAQPADNNTFVYRATDGKAEMPLFECQMIDSDVF